ncbi:antA/AntB antirepressor family protein [bacterium]|nr:antA/AntB antirepressor family protein [bacterium]
MSHLIPLTDRDGIPAVDARELHSFFESKQKFADWIKNRIASYEFIEGEDFSTNHKITNRQKSTEYTISLDMAKELSMVERNEKGKQD